MDKYLLRGLLHLICNEIFPVFGATGALSDLKNSPLRKLKRSVS